jgi:hypothetical protein
MSGSYEASGSIAGQPDWDEVEKFLDGQVDNGAHNYTEAWLLAEDRFGIRQPNDDLSAASMMGATPKEPTLEHGPDTEQVTVAKTYIDGLVYGREAKQALIKITQMAAHSELRPWEVEELLNYLDGRRPDLR